MFFAPNDISNGDSLPEKDTTYFQQLLGIVHVWAAIQSKLIPAEVPKQAAIQLFEPNSDWLETGVPIRHSTAAG